MARERKQRQRARQRGEPESRTEVGPAADLLSPTASVDAPRPDERYSEWADRSLVVTAGPRRGDRWRCYEWQREPLDLAGAGGRIVVLASASQAGKSSIGLALGAGRMLAGEPTLFVMPNTFPAGTQFARERLEPLLSVPPMVHVLHSDRHGGLGKSSAVMFRTLTTGGSASLASAESPAQLAARGASCIVFDEAARFPPSAGKEGPPVSVALERTTAWRDSRAVVLLSSPVVEGDPFDLWYQDGDQRHWFCPCSSCGVFWAPEWEHVSDGAVPSLDCPECGNAHHEGEERIKLLNAGEWRATKEAVDCEIASFRMPRWSSPASSLASIIADRKRAERKRTLAVWTRTAAALPCEPDVDLVDVSDVEDRLEGWPEGWPPKNIDTVVLGCDVQADRIEAAVLGWPKSREWWACLDYHVLRGRPVYDEVWQELMQLVEDTGARLCAVDARHLPDRVWAVARRDRRVVGVMGKEGIRPGIQRPTAKGRFYTVGSDGVKRTVLEDASSGTLRLPAAPWCTKTWLHGLFSEQEKAVERSGRRVMAWVPTFRRNEPLDCLTYARAAVDLVPRSRPRRGVLKV